MGQMATEIVQSRSLYVEGMISTRPSGRSRVVVGDGGALTAQVCVSLPEARRFGLQAALLQNTNLAGDVIGLRDGCCHGNPPSGSPHARARPRNGLGCHWPYFRFVRRLATDQPRPPGQSFPLQIYDEIKYRPGVLPFRTKDLGLFQDTYPGT